MSSHYHLEACGRKTQLAAGIRCPPRHLIVSPSRVFRLVALCLGPKGGYHEEHDRADLFPSANLVADAFLNSQRIPDTTKQMTTTIRRRPFVTFVTAIRRHSGYALRLRIVAGLCPVHRLNA